MKRRTWRPAAARTRARWWITHRLVPLGFAAAVAGLLLHLLLQPFFHPHAYLLFGSATYPEAFMPAFTAPAEDLACLLLRQVELLNDAKGESPARKGQIPSPAALDAILRQLDGTEVRNRDVLIVWIGAQALTCGGRVDLLCGDSDLSDIQSGRYPLSALLDRVRACPARTKLILLDTGRTAHAPRLGVFAECSPHQIRQLVRDTNDPTLWVMLSHSELERSHAIGDRRCSAFALFVGEGLQGLADRDEDRFVDLGELYPYVRDRLSEFVRRQSGGRSAQTPALIWGGDQLTPTAAYPLLVPAVLRTEADDAEQTADAADSLASAPSRPTTGTQLTRHGPRLAVDGPTRISLSPSASRPGQAVMEATELASPDAASRSKGEASPRGEAESRLTPGDEGLAKKTRATRTAVSDASAELSPRQADSAGQQATLAEAPVARPLGPQADPITSATAEQLWDMAWSLHDRLALSAELRPVEDAPHSWRALQDRLLNLQRAFQAADPQGNAAATAGLRRLVRQLDDLAAGRTPQRFQKHDLIAELARWSETTVPDRPAHSLAMEEQLARRAGTPLSLELAAVAARLDMLASKGGRADFEQWIAELPSEFDRYVECRLARGLAGGGDVTWPNVQLALRARRLGESVAAETLESGDWTRGQIEQADRLRLAGERNLLAPVRPDDSSTAALMLRRAIVEYDQVVLRNHEVVTTQRLADEAMFYLHDYLHWSIISLAGANVAAFDPAELSQLLRHLTQAIELLDRPSAGRMPELRRVRRQLELALDRLRERICGSGAPMPTLGQPQIQNSPVSQTAVHGPLAATAVRIRLLELCHPSYESSVDYVEPLPQAAKHDRLRRLRDLAGQYAESIRALLGDFSTSNEHARAVDGAASRCANSKAGADDLWKACAELGEALRDFYESVPPTLERLSADNQDLTDPAQRDQRIRNLRSARRLLYLVHPWDINRVECVSPAQLVRRAQRYDRMVWLQRRLAAELDDAPPSEREYLVEAAAAYGRAAMAIPLQPPVTPVAPPLIEIEASQRVDLAHKPDLELPIVVTSRHESPIDVWLSVDYDRRMLDVAPRDDDALYDPNRLRLSPGLVAEQPGEQSADTGNPEHSIPPSLGVYPIRPSIDALQPTFRLRSGETKGVWIRIVRKALSGTDARIVVRAISRSDYLRHDLTVELPRHPSFDLVVEGIPDSWQPSESKLALYPFPNRTTAYTLSLLNSGLVEKEVDFEILRAENTAAVSLPSGAVSAQTAEECLARVGASGSVVKLEKLAAPAGGKPVAIPFVPPTEKEQEDSAKQAEKPSEKPTPLSDLLVAVITDRATGLRTMKPIEILTQRPGRYVAARVEYDPIRRRVEVRVRAANAAALPPDGVWITCEPERLEAGETPFRPRAALRPPAAETLLFLEVPPDAGPVFPIQVHVDGFQRVFRYEVPADATSRAVVPESHRVGVRILEPRDDTAFGPQPTEIDAVLEVDVPRGLPADGKSFVEVGIDADRDRELEGDEKLLLTSDRQVELFLERLGKDGTLTIRTRMDDLHVTLPPPKLKDARAGLIAQVRLSGKEVWSDPVELIFDSEAPRLSRLQLAPGPNVVQGGELEVSVLASDQGLSGVAKVEAGFDLQRRGEFGDEPAPLAGSLQPDGRWVVNVPTAELKPGVYSVLVRSTDRLGNASDYLKVPVKVISQDAARAGMPAPNRVRGRVVYGKLGKSPVGGATVRLIAKGDQKAIQATTDEDGRFAFDQVVPGEYELAAEVLVRGNQRSAKLGLQVPAPPTAVEPVELILQTPR